jgi:hypothetical protein
MPLQFLHTSLGDFLTDHSRSKEEFVLDPGISHRKITTWILKEMENLSSNMLIFYIYVSD